MADVQQMFHCFYVQEKDRDFLSFLRHRNNDPELELVEYRMRVHTFGNSPSPAIATFGMRRAVSSVKEVYGEDVCNFVQDDFYVDDGLLSVPNAETAIDTLKRTQTAMMEGGNLRLHKISSNSAEVMQSFPEDDLAENLKDLTLGADVPPLQRSLGIFWDVASDMFTCRVSSEEKPFTKRGVLSTIGSLYDPLGLLAPVIIRGKLFFRKIMNLNLEWDDPLPLELKNEWDQWKLSLKELETLNVSRSYAGGLADKSRKELHVFSDASNDAIASVVYLRTIDAEGHVSLSFVLGKAKVAPSGGHTIPRLELCAAVLGSQILETVLTSLKTEIDNIKLYTDSRIVLGYISNTSRRFHVYVGNRVQQIRSTTKPIQWTHVGTDNNPADEGSRSIRASKIVNSAWLNGPVFLLKNSSVSPPSVEFALVEPHKDKEIRPVVHSAKSAVVNKTTRNSLFVEKFENYSEWSSLVRAISYLTHIAKSFHTPEGTCKGWHSCDRP
ncbi:uncharacterized protein LOC110454597 [Mizuhopecten yessoensis]|uniref:uncharacterized protein LOC110454597 n=1 Tax=Mizuhopecten yessoensis TaxID=6573 RepID=UPI000B458BE1|nr:uncharacterized protein LOC110454597 [Mizuhopecten yessoensis]